VLPDNSGMTVSRRPVDLFAQLAGASRLVTGISFLVGPERAHRMWGGPEDPGPWVAPFVRSTGYRDMLIGGLLLAAGLRGRPTTGWFLAWVGADVVDLAGSYVNVDRMTNEQRIQGLGGPVVAIVVGLSGALAAARAGRH
jgi:hypothetical protein